MNPDTIKKDSTDHAICTVNLISKRNNQLFSGGAL